jgi:tetratricopeptide (TPR) repeat protein
MGSRQAPVVALVAALALPVSPALANRASDELKAKGANYLYNLDREAALDAYRAAIAADPDDAGAYRGLASALWLSITFDRGNMTIDDYLGKVGRADLKLPPPRPDTAKAFRDNVDRALALARKHVAARPKDPDSHFQLGAAVGLRASYIVTVEGRVMGAVGAAREAYEEHEKVLELDNKRADAGLIVGTYRYVVSVMALPLRWMAYLSGFGGGRERGLRMIEGAANYPGENRTDARLALILLYNRERNYERALEQLTALIKEYPRNRLFLLEAGGTYIRAGRLADAERILSEGIGRFPTDSRRRMFGEESLWYYKRGVARAALGRASDAERDLRKAISLPGRGWVQGRAHLEIGKMMMKASNRAGANAEFRQAIRLCESDNDRTYAAEARRLLK